MNLFPTITGCVAAAYIAQGRRTPNRLREKLTQLISSVKAEDERKVMQNNGA